MPPDLTYSFDDEVASKFCYDLDGKRLEIYFTGCWEIATRRYHNGPCHLLIHQWTDARCQEEVVSSSFGGKSTPSRLSKQLHRQCPGAGGSDEHITWL